MSEPHQVSEPLNALAFYRRYQFLEQEVVRLRAEVRKQVFGSKVVFDREVVERAEGKKDHMAKTWWISGIGTVTFTEHVEADTYEEACEKLRQKPVVELQWDSEEIEITGGGPVPKEE